MIVLDKVFRQKDSDFLRLLNELRRGIVSKSTNEILMRKVDENNRKLAMIERKFREAEFLSRQKGFSREKEVKEIKEVVVVKEGNEGKEGKEGKEGNEGKDGETEGTISSVQPTKLYATNRDVDSYNQSELNKLSTENGVVNYKAVDVGVEQYLRQLVAGIKAPSLLELRVGAQVNIKN